MGTLFNQEPRKMHRTFDYSDKPPFDELMEELLERTKKYKISLQQAIDVAKLSEEMRRSDMTINDWDSKDEQLAGFGEILSCISESVRRFVDND